ncbi:unnamed protein product [Lupinus luteus]|uniref:Uncharacterized protein n=1 Tax=Lupinus luteus TaxID=3873 RepID=A0AAV1WA55_LUPLU
MFIFQKLDFWLVFLHCDQSRKRRHRVINKGKSTFLDRRWDVDRRLCSFTFTRESNRILGIPINRPFLKVLSYEISSSPEASEAKETTSTASPVPRLLLSKDRRQPRSKKALGDRPHTRDSWIGSCTGRAGQQPTLDFPRFYYSIEE